MNFELQGTIGLQKLHFDEQIKGTGLPDCFVLSLVHANLSHRTTSNDFASSGFIFTKKFLDIFYYSLK